MKAVEIDHDGIALRPVGARIVALADDQAPVGEGADRRVAIFAADTEPDIAREAEVTVFRAIDVKPPRMEAAGCFGTLQAVGRVAERYPQVGMIDPRALARAPIAGAAIVRRVDLVRRRAEQL